MAISAAWAAVLLLHTWRLLTNGPSILMIRPTLHAEVATIQSTCATELTKAMAHWSIIVAIAIAVTAAPSRQLHTILLMQKEMCIIVAAATIAMV